MQLSGQQVISLPIEEVWAALNDPNILQKCIPGCSSLESTGDDQYKIQMTAVVGPVKAKFAGDLQLLNITPPSSYKLKFAGSGGAAGSGKGAADVSLSTIPEGTLLQYSASATVAGRLAQVGARLIDGVAKKMADQFFSEFKAILEPDVASEAIDVPGDISPASVPTSRSHNMKWSIAVGAAVVIFLLYFLLSS